MLKKLYNEAIITFEFEPDGPILIKSGKDAVAGPDMSFIKTFRNGKYEVFVPGSSIKGVLRSYSEKILRTINSEAACMPYVSKNHLKKSTKKDREKEYLFCGEYFGLLEKDKINLSNEQVYKESCLACKLFGSTYFKGRLETSDAYIISDSFRLETRDGVAIDRFTGGSAHGAKFNMEVLVEAKFKTSVFIHNFEIWQLSLVIQSISDLLNGFVRIGFNKSRGLGKIKGGIIDTKIYYFLNNLPDKNNLYGIGAFVNSDNLYGFDKNDKVVLDNFPEPVQKGIRFEYIFSNIDEILSKTYNILLQKASNYSHPVEYKNKVNSL